MVIKGRAQIVVIFAVLLALGSPLIGGAHDPEKPSAPEHGHDQKGHVHAPVPADYRGNRAPAGLWMNTAAIERGKAIYAVRCALCHGERGGGDGPAAAGLALKPASFRDGAMVAEMTNAYWFWRVSEGGLVEPFRSAGSARSDASRRSLKEALVSTTEALYLSSRVRSAMAR